MNVTALFEHFNTLIALPAAIIFFGAGIFLTLKTRLIQFRAFSRFATLIKQGFSENKQTTHSHDKTINRFHALFTAMGTTIGTGNVVGPSIAIFTGGPGALVWLIVYIFFASATKFIEVCFGLSTRIKKEDGTIIGGPMEYLKLIHPMLAYWYVFAMGFLLVYWSGLQANTLANICRQESISPFIVGLFLALICFAILQGGAQRVGSAASKLVPVMFVLYVSFSFFILFKNMHVLAQTLKLIASSVFSPAAAMGGFAGATILKAMQAGSFQAIFISEAGLGTSSIPHSIADTKKPTDQGILALYSMIADACLSLISGLLVLITGVWMTGEFRSTFIYEVFKLNSPLLGRLILLGAVTLFVITTIIGNIFNGSQSISSVVRGSKLVRWYILSAIMFVLIAPFLPVRLIWEAMNTVLFLVAVPNLLSLVLLSVKKPEVYKF